MAENVRVMVVEPSKMGDVREVPNTLDAFQKIVGGFIEGVNIGDGFHLIYQEGNLKEMPLRTIKRDAIDGAFIVAKEGHGGDLTPLTDVDVALLKRQYGL